MKPLLAFGSTKLLDKGVEKPQCVICYVVLNQEALKSSRLNGHLLSKHPYLKNKYIEFFERKEKILN